MKKKTFGDNTTIAIIVAIWAFVTISQLLIYHFDKVSTLKEYNAQLESEVEELKQCHAETESLWEDAQNTLLVVSSTERQNGEYIKIQDRMSMDFSSEDVRYIYAFIDIRGGSVEDRALNMVILLNNIYDTRQSIKDYVTYHLGPNLSFEFKDVKADREAYEMVAYEHWDESNGARWFTK